MDPAPRSEQEEPDKNHVTEKADSVAGGHHDTGFVVGSMVGGRYKILSEIGRGGMGVVFKVEQVFFREIYAFKLLQEQHLQGKPLVRFQTEAQATNRLNHRNLVSCKDFGLLEDNRPFLVMEFIQGVTLEEALKSRGPLPIKEVLEIFLQVCDGMAYAHDHGIIHRDLKPSNIMLPDRPFDTKSDVVKILDFGIAKIVCDEDRQAVTRTGEIFGSPYYMSPEQCLGKNIDLRSDIYALGCVFFEALTGLPPYAAETALATMMQHQSNTIPTLKQASLGGDFPQALEQLVARLLAKDPHHRYQSMMALKHDLQRVHDDQDIQWTGVQKTTAPKRQDFTTKSVSIGAAAIALVALFLIAITLMRPAPAPTTSAAPKPAAAMIDDVSLAKAITHSDNSYYAKIPLKQAHGPWTLNFPDESIGTVALPPFKGNSHDGHRAQGTVTFTEPYPLSFIASSNACEKPKTFRRFRPDELWSVDVSNLMEASDDLMISLDHLSGLHGLILVSVDISDTGLEHLKNLPNLKDVRVSDSKITGAGLAKLKCIKKLDELWIDQIENVQPVLKALEGSTTFKYLSAKHDRLTDADMTCISHMPKLEELRLAHDPINDAELAKLVGLKKLQNLDISHCTEITSASIPTLLSFPRLATLYLDISNWPDDKQRSFRQQFRGKLIKEKLPFTDDNPASESNKE